MQNNLIKKARVPRIFQIFYRTSVSFKGIFQRLTAHAAHPVGASGKDGSNQFLHVLVSGKFFARGIFVGGSMNKNGLYRGK